MSGAGGRGAEGGGRGKVAVRGRSGRSSGSRGNSSKREEPVGTDTQPAKGDEAPGVFKCAASESFLLEKWQAAEADKATKRYAAPGSGGNVCGGSAAKKLCG